MTVEWFSKKLIRNIRDIIDDISEQGAEWVAADARRLVPVSKKPDGEIDHLKTRLDVRKSKFKDGGYSVYAQGPNNYDKFYAIFVELGTSKMTARPFLRPALRRNKRRIMDAYKNKLK